MHTIGYYILLTFYASERLVKRILTAEYSCEGGQDAHMGGRVQGGDGVKIVVVPAW